LGSYKVHFFNHPAVLPAGFFLLSPTGKKLMVLQFIFFIFAAIKKRKKCENSFRHTLPTMEPGYLPFYG